MYGVTEIMNPVGSSKRKEPTASKNAALSPELREVLHMLEAFEQKSSADKGTKS